MKTKPKDRFNALDWTILLLITWFILSGLYTSIKWIIMLF